MTFSIEHYRLDGKVATDEMTSRRLFTLICVLQTK